MEKDILDSINALPSLELYERILDKLNAINKQIILLDNRLDKMENYLRSKHIAETNNQIRKYALKSNKKDPPIKFVPTHLE